MSARRATFARRLGRLVAPALVLAALIAAVAGTATATAATNAGGVRLEPLGRFLYPTDVGGPPGDQRRLFVAQRGGVVRVVLDGHILRHSFVDLTRRVDQGGGERGLLSLAFAPDYATSRLAYFAYTARDGALTVEEWRASAARPSRAESGSRRLVFRQSHPNRTHNGGQLQFGPDGLLYLGTGDGGGEGDRLGNAQDLGGRLGKILRIDPRPPGGSPYSVPPGNPFVGVPGAAPEVYAYGFRNPWRFSFDRLTGDLAVADVGQDTSEEIDFLRHGGGAGRDFGWRRCEGTRAFPQIGAPCPLADTVRPVIELRHADGYCAVIGGYVVRDPSLPGLYGRYVYGDFCRGGLRSASLTETGAHDDRPVGLSIPSLSAFGEDANGCLYAVSLAGEVQRIAAAATAPRCPAAGTPSARPPGDRRRPALALAAPSRVRLGGSGRLRVRVRCDEPCQVTARLRVGAGARRARAGRGARILQGGQTARVLFTVPREDRRAIGSKGASATVRVRVRDAAGNGRTVTRRVRVLVRHPRADRPAPAGQPLGAPAPS